jgi:hypothetical protein
MSFQEGGIGTLGRLSDGSCAHPCTVVPSSHVSRELILLVFFLILRSMINLLYIITISGRAH